MTVSRVFERILITGGAGFIGATLAIRLSEAGFQVCCMDNFLRRGSELNLPRLRDAGANFVHGDIRCPEDFDRIEDFDLLIDCAAEPSVHAGASGSPRFVVQNNLVGSINCFEEARRRCAAVLFLSTSRVYPIASINAVPWVRSTNRFEWEIPDGMSGVSELGVDEEFPLEGARSFYGASKLTSEIVAAEYAQSAGTPTLINRCGVIAGPWQMGRVDQGFVALWASRHLFKKPLSYAGWGGEGFQVRDVLHVDDLVDLLIKQIAKPEFFDGRVYNVGGGRTISTSLVELTMLCRQLTGTSLKIGQRRQTNPLDVRIYVTDASRVRKDFDWCPTRSLSTIVRDTVEWLQENRELVVPYFG